jgi:hypothetical protein
MPSPKDRPLAFDNLAISPTEKMNHVNVEFALRVACAIATLLSRVSGNIITDHDGNCIYVKAVAAHASHELKEFI